MRALSESSSVRPLDETDRFESLMLNVVAFANRRIGPTYGTAETKIRRWDGYGTQAHPEQGILVDRSEVKVLLEKTQRTKAGAGVPQEEIDKRIAFAAQFMVAHEYGHMIQYKTMSPDTVLNPSSTRIIECAADILGGALLRSYVQSLSLDSAEAETALGTAVDFGWIIGNNNWLDGTTHPVPETRRSCIRSGQTAQLILMIRSDSTPSARFARSTWGSRLLGDERGLYLGEVDLVRFAYNRSQALTDSTSVVGESLEYAVTQDTSISDFVRHVAMLAVRGSSAMRQLEGPSVPSIDSATSVLRRAPGRDWGCTFREQDGIALARCTTEMRSRDEAARRHFGRVVVAVMAALEQRWLRERPSAPESRLLGALATESFAFQGDTPEHQARIVARLERVQAHPAIQMLPPLRITLDISAAP